MTSARGADLPEAQPLGLEPMPLAGTDVGARESAGSMGVPNWMEQVPEAVVPPATELQGVTEPPAQERPKLAPRPGQVREERVPFVARNRIEEPGEWLPETPSPCGPPTTKAGRQTQRNWLPVVLSLVAVAVLVVAMAVLVMEGHRRTTAIPIEPAETAR